MMKKICLLALLGSMFFLGACTNEEIAAPKVLSQEEGLCSFEAGFQPSDGRTVMEENGKVKWKAGDEIVLFNATSSARFVALADGASTMFVLKEGENALDPKGIYTAFYPANKYNVASRTFSVEQTQTAIAGSFDPDAALCMATVTNREYATFSNLCTLLKINVPQAAIDGGATVMNLSTPSYPVVSGGTIASDGTLNWNQTIKNFRLEGSFEYGKDYYLAIPPQTFEQGFTLAMNNSSNATIKNCARTKASAVTLESSKSYAMGTIFEVEVDYSWYEEVVEETPDATEFELSTPEEMVGFVQLLTGNAEARAATITFEGKTIKLGGDLDMKFYSDAVSPIENFKGSFDGQGYSIQNLKIVSDKQYVGLFATIGTGTTIQNITLKDGWVKSNGLMTGNSYVGALVGCANGGTLINCHNDGCDVMSTGANYVAGILGSAAYGTDVTLIACSNTADVTCLVNGEGHVGGVANSLQANMDIVACYNIGNVYMGYDGLCGVGGVTGYLCGNSQMWACYHSGSVTGYGWQGSLAGISDQTTLFGHSAYWDVEGVDWIAGYYGVPTYMNLYYASYANVVSILNVGIDYYNEKGLGIPCEYYFVEGNTPSLKWMDPDKGIGSPGLDEGEIF